MTTQSSDIMSVISFVMIIACLCTTDAVLRLNLDQMMEDLEEDEQWNGSELKDSQKTTSYEEIPGRLTDVAPDQITYWSPRYLSRKRPRSLLQDPTPSCGTRNITMKASWFNWDGVFVRGHSGNIVQVKFAIFPYQIFNLTICDGSCRGTDIENKAFFKDFHSRLLARLTQKEAAKLQLGHKPCCVPSKYGEEEVLIALFFVGKDDNHIHEGRVVGLKNAVACECL